MLFDYCDGKGFNDHPLFSLHNDAFQIFLYYDEVEICNALGSKAKIHKLGMRIYFKCTLSCFKYMQEHSTSL